MYMKTEYDKLEFEFCDLTTHGPSVLVRMTLHVAVWQRGTPMIHTFDYLAYSNIPVGVSSIEPGSLITVTWLMPISLAMFLINTYNTAPNTNMLKLVAYMYTYEATWPRISKPKAGRDVRQH